jgi:hypothetical protein
VAAVEQARLVQQELEQLVELVETDYHHPLQELQ